MDSNGLPTTTNLAVLMPFVEARHDKVSAVVDDYIELLDCLAKSGFRTIELGHVPLKANGVLSAALRLADSWHDLRLLTTVSDVEAMGEALELGVKDVSVQLAPSDELSRHYFGTSVNGRLRQLEPIIELAGSAQVAVRGQVLGAFPGVSSEDKFGLTAETAFYAKHLMKMGCFEVVLVDSAGIASVAMVASVFSALKGLVGFSDLAVRFGDQNGQALVNTMNALECGAASVDVVSSDSELAVSSNDLLFSLASKAVVTNIDERQLAQVALIQERRYLLAEETRLASIQQQPLRLVSSSKAL